MFTSCSLVIGRLIHKNTLSIGYVLTIFSPGSSPSFKRNEEACCETLQILHGKKQTPRGCLGVYGSNGKFCVLALSDFLLFLLKFRFQRFSVADQLFLQLLQSHKIMLCHRFGGF